MKETYLVVSCGKFALGDYLASYIIPWQGLGLNSVLQGSTKLP